MSLPHYPEIHAHFSNYHDDDDDEEQEQHEQEQQEQEQQALDIVNNDDRQQLLPQPEDVDVDSGLDSPTSTNPQMPTARVLAPDPMGYSSGTTCFRHFSPEVLRWSVGCLLAILAGCCFTASDFVLKQFKLDYVEVLLTRSVLQILANAAFMAIKRYPFWPSTATRKQKIFMILNSIFSALRMVCIYSSLRLMPLGDAITIFFTIPIFTMAFSLIFLREPIKLWKITFGILLLVGIVLIVRPPFIFPPPPPPKLYVGPWIKCYINANVSAVAPPSAGHDHMYYVGVLLALGVALFGGVANVAVGVSGRGINAAVLVFYCGLVCIPVGLVASSFDPHQRVVSHLITTIPLIDWGKLVLQCAISLTGTVMVTISITMANPTIASVLAPVVEIVLGYVIQVTVMDDVPTALGIIGAAIVVVAVVAITLERYSVAKLPLCCRHLW